MMKIRGRLVIFSLVTLAVFFLAVGTGVAQQKLTDIAIPSRDSTIKIFETRTGKQIYNLYPHSKSFYSIEFSPNGDYLAIGSGIKGGVIEIWKVR